MLIVNARIWIMKAIQIFLHILSYRYIQIRYENLKGSKLCFHFIDDSFLDNLSKPSMIAMKVWIKKKKFVSYNWIVAARIESHYSLSMQFQ